MAKIEEKRNLYFCSSEDLRNERTNRRAVKGQLKSEKKTENTLQRNSQISNSWETSQFLQFINCE